MVTVIAALIAAAAAVATALIARGNKRDNSEVTRRLDFADRLVETLEKDKAAMRREARSREEACDQKVRALESRVAVLEAELRGRRQ